MKKCKELTCNNNVTHPVVKMCDIHYSEHRRLSKKVSHDKLMSNPIQNKKILEYYRSQYHQVYKQQRKKVKYCGCGQIAQKGSRLQLCASCGEAHRKQHKIEYQLNRKRSHLATKIRENVKGRLKVGLKGVGSNSKKSPIAKILGCSINELLKHLELSFHLNPLTQEEMSWDNYGFYGWHIDHIKPLASASSEEEILLLCHYTNLKSLWAEENFKKGDSYVESDR